MFGASDVGVRSWGYRDGRFPPRLKSSFSNPYEGNTYRGDEPLLEILKIARRRIDEKSIHHLAARGLSKRSKEEDKKTEQPVLSSEFDEKSYEDEAESDKESFDDSDSKDELEDSYPTEKRARKNFTRDRKRGSRKSDQTTEKRTEVEVRTMRTAMSKKGLSPNSEGEDETLMGTTLLEKRKDKATTSSGGFVQGVDTPVQIPAAKPVELSTKPAATPGLEFPINYLLFL